MSTFLWGNLVPSSSLRRRAIYLSASTNSASLLNPCFSQGPRTPWRTLTGTTLPNLSRKERGKALYSSETSAVLNVCNHPQTGVSTEESNTNGYTEVPKSQAVTEEKNNYSCTLMHEPIQNNTFAQMETWLNLALKRLSLPLNKYEWKNIIIIIIHIHSCFNSKVTVRPMTSQGSRLSVTLSCLKFTQALTAHKPLPPPAPASVVRQ